jgi:hypothetical protein
VNDVMVDNEVLALVPETRREIVGRIISETSYATPSMASYDMDTLTLSPRAAIIISNGTDF